MAESDADGSRWHEDDPNPPTSNATWVPLLLPFELDPLAPGTSADHEMGVYGEVTKFLWFLCDSVREEPDACYIMANEFSAVTIPMLMILEPGWSYQKAQIESMDIYKTVIPQYLLATQTLDFLCFTEGLYKLAERYLPDQCAEDKALWLARLGNRTTHRTDTGCVGEDGRPENARVLRNMQMWSTKHRQCQEAMFGTSTDVAAMFEIELAEELATDFVLYDAQKDLEALMRDFSFVQRVVGLFGAEPGSWKYDVSKYFKRVKHEIKPMAHTVQYLKELSEESLRSRTASEPEEIATPVIEVIVNEPEQAPENETIPPKAAYKPKKKIPRCIKVAAQIRSILWICPFTRTIIPRTTAVPGPRTIAAPASHMSQHTLCESSGLVSHYHSSVPNRAGLARQGTFPSAITSTALTHLIAELPSPHISDVESQDLLEAHPTPQDADAQAWGLEDVSEGSVSGSILARQLSGLNSMINADEGDSDQGQVLHMKTQQHVDKQITVVLQTDTGHSRSHIAAEDSCTSSACTLGVLGGMGGVSSMSSSGDTSLVHNRPATSGSFGRTDSMGTRDSQRPRSQQLQHTFGGQHPDMFIGGTVKSQLPVSPRHRTLSSVSMASLSFSCVRGGVGLDGASMGMGAIGSSTSMLDSRHSQGQARIAKSKLPRRAVFLQPTRVLFDASEKTRYPVMYEFPIESLGMRQSSRRSCSRSLSLLPSRSGSRQGASSPQLRVLQEEANKRLLLMNEMKQMQQQHNRSQSVEVMQDHDGIINTRPSQSMPPGSHMVSDSNTQMGQAAWHEQDWNERISAPSHGSRQETKHRRSKRERLKSHEAQLPSGFGRSTSAEFSGTMSPWNVPFDAFPPLPALVPGAAQHDAAGT